MEKQEVISISSHGAGAVAFFNQKVLLVQMNYSRYKGDWILPGGMVNDKEHPHEGAIREFKEETDLDIEIKRMICVRHRIQNESQKDNTYWVYEAQILNENPENRLKWPKEELIDVKFWDIKAALESNKVRQHTKYYIELLINKNNTHFMEKLKGRHNDVSYVL